MLQRLRSLSWNRQVATASIAWLSLVGCSGSSGSDGASPTAPEDPMGMVEPTTMEGDGPPNGQPVGPGDSEGAPGNDPNPETQPPGSPAPSQPGGIDNPQPAPDPMGEPGQETPTPDAPLLDGVPETSRVLRLTHADFDRVLTDLLGMPVDVSRNFPEEIPTLDGYFENAALSVNDRLKTELTRTAEQLSQEVRENPTAYSFVVGCEAGSTACRDEFIGTFISRAYRRPITPAEQSAYTELFDDATEWIQSDDPFADGVQLVIEAALQSPNFLYRIEQGTGEQDAYGLRLTDHELATRLSFLFWGTMPDETLRAEADAGNLTTDSGLRQQAARLANDPRVSFRVRDFHERWLHIGDLPGVSKDSTVFPPFNADLVSSMQQETLRFVEEVTLHEGGGIRELLTAPYGFADENLAALYELDGAFGADLVRVDYEAASPRLGLLTQASFLTGHSSSATTTSPILRGIFVLDRLTCYAVPEPPPNATSMEPPPPEVPPVTTRDLFTWKTSLPSCAGCHRIINPTGFAFEAFDAIGRHRTEENGAPIDASGDALFPTTFSFENAKEYLTQLATMPETQSCYANHWLQYAYGRHATEQDGQTLSDLTSGFRDGGFGAREVLLRLAESPAFTHFQQ